MLDCRVAIPRDLSNVQSGAQGPTTSGDCKRENTQCKPRGPDPSRPGGPTAGVNCGEKKPPRRRRSRVPLLLLLLLRRRLLQRRQRRGRRRGVGGAAGRRKGPSSPPSPASAAQLYLIRAGALLKLEPRGGSARAWAARGLCSRLGRAGALCCSHAGRTGALLLGPGPGPDSRKRCRRQSRFKTEKAAGEGRPYTFSCLCSCPEAPHTAGAAALEHVAPHLPWADCLGPVVLPPPRAPLVEGAGPGAVARRCGSNECLRLEADEPRPPALQPGPGAKGYRRRGARENCLLSCQCRQSVFAWFRRPEFQHWIKRLPGGPSCGSSQVLRLAQEVR